MNAKVAASVTVVRGFVTLAIRRIAAALELGLGLFDLATVLAIDPPRVHNLTAQGTAIYFALGGFLLYDVRFCLTVCMPGGTVYAVPKQKTLRGSGAVVQWIAFFVGYCAGTLFGVTDVVSRNQALGEGQDEGQRAEEKN